MARRIYNRLEVLLGLTPEIETMIFMGGKPENPEKNPRGKGENQQTTQLT
jgi:hypothetical protein